jgi:outer membrane protein TolC
MKVRNTVLFVCIGLLGVGVSAQEKKAVAERAVTLDEAVQLAFEHNHYVRLAAYKVEESVHAKEAVRSLYLPNLKNDTMAGHVTDTQFIAIPRGELGTAAGVPIPEGTAVLNQGGLSFITSGTQLSQPLLDLFKVRSANDAAAADTKAIQSKAEDTKNKIALQVHELYYKVLILQTKREAAQAKIKANEDLRNERIEQVKFGATLEQESIEARAQALDARQEMLTTDLQLDDAMTQLNDAIGLP